MSTTSYLFDLEMPPVYLGETMMLVKKHQGVEISYEETVTWDAGAAVGLIRVITSSLTPIDDLYRWWRMKQRAIGFPFEMIIRAGNRSRILFSKATAEQVREYVIKNQDAMIDRLTEGER